MDKDGAGCSFGNTKFTDIDNKITQIENRLDSGTTKMNSIYWIGIVGILLGVVKITIEMVK